jgi:hypothetical protein
LIQFFEHLETFVYHAVWLAAPIPKDQKSTTFDPFSSWTGVEKKKASTIDRMNTYTNHQYIIECRFHHSGLRDETRNNTAGCLQGSFEAGRTVQARQDCLNNVLWLHFNHFPIPTATVIISESRYLQNQDTVVLPRCDI